MINRESIEKMIRTKQIVRVTIGTETFKFEGIVLYDSLINPPHRLEAYDYKGNAVFVLLENHSGG